MSLAAKAASLLRPRESRSRVGPIGIDFSLESLHLVQLEVTDGKALHVRARASLPFGRPRREILDNPLLLRDLMKRGLAADRFSGRRAVVAIPSGMFRTMSINYKSAPGNEQESAAVIKVMKERLDGDLADFVLDYMPVKSRSKNDERLALVAVSEHATVVGFLEVLRKAGIDAQALEIGPVAIGRLVGELAMDRGSDNVLVINSGRRASYLTLISSSDLLFDQEVAFGEDNLIRQVAETLEMSTEMSRELILRTGVCPDVLAAAAQAGGDDAALAGTVSEILKPQFLKLAEEIKRVCLYAAAETRGGGVSQVYLLGSIARWQGSDQLLSVLSGTEVAVIQDPLALFGSSADGTSPVCVSAAPEVVVATGAALRGIHRHG